MLRSRQICAFRESFMWISACFASYRQRLHLYSRTRSKWTACSRFWRWLHRNSKASRNSKLWTRQDSFDFLWCFFFNSIFRAGNSLLLGYDGSRRLRLNLVGSNRLRRKLDLYLVIVDFQRNLSLRLTWKTIPLFSFRNSNFEALRPRLSKKNRPCIENQFGKEPSYIH